LTLDAGKQQSLSALGAAGFEDCSMKGCSELPSSNYHPGGAEWFNFYRTQRQAEFRWVAASTSTDEISMLQTQRTAPFAPASAERAISWRTTMARSEQFHYEDWIIDVYLIQGDDPQTFCGVANISLGRKHRCKIVVTKPETTPADGLAALRAQCVMWMKTEGIRSPALHEHSTERLPKTPALLPSTAATLKDPLQLPMQPDL
jgi:hypothetical protein